MYKEEPEYNEPFEYDSEMIRNLCFNSYVQDDNSVKYPKNLSYRKFCQTVFEDRAYMKEIIPDEEYRLYENYLQMVENGYIPEWKKDSSQSEPGSDWNESFLIIIWYDPDIILTVYSYL